MAFTPRTNEYGIYNNPYWYDFDFNFGAVNPLWLPNCTTYALGRSIEIAGGQVKKYDVLSHMPNAANWLSATKWETSENINDIQLGDIIVWGEGGDVTSMGHVAVIEGIEEDKVWISQSNYVGRWVQDRDQGQLRDDPGTGSKRYFEYGYLNKSLTRWTRTYYYNSEGSGPSYGSLSLTNCKGLIHNPYAGGGPGPGPGHWEWVKVGSNTISLDLKDCDQQNPSTPTIEEILRDKGIIIDPYGEYRDPRGSINKYTYERQIHYIKDSSNYWKYQWEDDWVFKDSGFIDKDIWSD